MASNHPSSSAQKHLFRVSYVDTVVRETFVEAATESQAEAIVEEQVHDGVHHHAIDTYHDDMQVLPAGDGNRRRCFECGQ